MTPTQAVTQVPGTLDLCGRTFAILPPTLRDTTVTHQRMRGFAEAKAMSPLDYVVQKHSHLPPPVFAIAVSEAIKLGSAAPVAPPNEVIWDQYTTLEGVRWRVWYHITRIDKDVTIEEVAKWVTEDNHFDVSDALNTALGLDKIDPKKKT